MPQKLSMVLHGGAAVMQTSTPAPTTLLAFICRFVMRSWDRVSVMGSKYTPPAL